MSTGSTLDNICNENVTVPFFLNTFIRLQNNNLLKIIITQAVSYKEV